MDFVRLLSDQDISSQRWAQRRDLCQHSQEGLEAGSGYQTHPPHHQVSSHIPQPGECSQWGGRKTATRWENISCLVIILYCHTSINQRNIVVFRTIWHLLQQSKTLHRNPRVTEVFNIQAWGNISTNNTFLLCHLNSKYIISLQASRKRAENSDSASSNVKEDKKRLMTKDKKRTLKRL